MVVVLNLLCYYITKLFYKYKKDQNWVKPNIQGSLIGEKKGLNMLIFIVAESVWFAFIYIFIFVHFPVLELKNC